MNDVVGSMRITRSTRPAGTGALLASPRGANKSEKLGRSGAAERHLVIVLDSFSQAGVGIPLGLSARHESGAADYTLPSFLPPDP